MSTRALVTGGAGFIGSHLVRALLEGGWQVRVLDNLSTGSRDNLEAVLGDIEFLQEDMRSADACAAACSGVDTVFHLGALGSVPRSIADPKATNDNNVQGTLNLLVAARDSGVRRLVFSSSSSVYGDTPVMPKHEELRPCPRSPYAVSKLAGEEYCRAWNLSYGLETVILRYFNVFGPRQSPTSQYAAVIPRFVDAMLAGRQPVIYGDGYQSRDFSYVANVVHANKLAAHAAEAPGGVFNIACGERTTLRDVYETIARLLDFDMEARFEEGRAGDVRHSLADITAAKSVLGYEPLVYFRDGLEITVRAFLNGAEVEELGVRAGR
jgi:nucleoside-diphosphate-sugar epimerase